MPLDDPTFSAFMSHIHFFTGLVHQTYPLLDFEDNEGLIAPEKFPGDIVLPFAQSRVVILWSLAVSSSLQ